MLRDREAADRARGAAPAALRDAIPGFAIELGRVRSGLGELDRSQRA